MSKYQIVTGENSERFAGQTSAKLVSATMSIVKDIPHEWIVKNIDNNKQIRGTCIILSFVGNKGIPFAVVKSYGSATLRRYRDRLIGKDFEIISNEIPVDSEQLKLL